MAKKNTTLPVIHATKDDGCFVGVLAGKSVRLFGKTKTYAKGGPVDSPYDVTFRIGDEVEYDSYNLSYTGHIVSIGAKTVTINTGRGEPKRRLKLEEFSWRNRRFDAEETRRKNHEEMMHL